ncbi:MAG: hypothetical protein WCP85_20430 [Mariniphaga sp.]
MKVRSINFASYNRFDCQFQDLNSVEMNLLRGGGEPPIPPTSAGDDWIIDILAPKKVDSLYTTSVFTTATTLTTPVTVDNPYKKPKKK